MKSFCLYTNLNPKSLAWRKLNGADDIVDTWTPPEVITKYFSFGQVGKDKFSCPGEVFTAKIDYYDTDILICLIIYDGFVFFHLTVLVLYSLHLRSRSNGYKRNFAIGHEERLYAFSNVDDGEGKSGNVRREYAHRKEQIMPTHFHCRHGTPFNEANDLQASYGYRNGADQDL